MDQLQVLKTVINSQFSRSSSTSDIGTDVDAPVDSTSDEYFSAEGCVNFSALEVAAIRGIGTNVVAHVECTFDEYVTANSDPTCRQALPLTFYLCDLSHAEQVETLGPL